MLDASILLLPNKADKVAAVKAALLDAIDAGTFTYTELLLEDEGLYTLAFEILDGVVTSSGNVPQYGATQSINVGPVRLVSIDKEQPIKFTEWYEPRIPGSNVRGKAVKRTVDLGIDAMVDDSVDSGRRARALLLKYGWPNRNIKSRSGNVGHIVEWRWLEKAAAIQGDSEENRDIRKLYAELKARTEQANEPKTQRKNAPAQGAGANP